VPSHTPLTVVRRAVAIVVVTLSMAGCSAAASSTPLPSGSSGLPLIGSWTTTITKDDLRAAGITDPGLLNENSGRFIWTFLPDRTWTVVQQSLDGSPVRQPVFRGHFTLDGPILVAVTEFPAEFRDNGLRYRWTLANGEVRFELLNPPDPIASIVVGTHPWKAGS
jgi:hypothetical protein